MFKAFAHLQYGNQSIIHLLDFVMMPDVFQTKLSLKYSMSCRQMCAICFSYLANLKYKNIGLNY